MRRRRGDAEFERVIEIDPETGFAGVYDVIYRGPEAFYAAQLAFLRTRLPGVPARVLDAGCGTARQAAALAGSGYQVVGLDLSWPMLRRAAARPPVPPLSSVEGLALVLGDLRALPCAAAFDAVICLESPLAYLLDDTELALALDGFWRVLRPGGRLIVDVFDFPGTLGPDGSDLCPSYFRTPAGMVVVRERHSLDPGAGQWNMRQDFTVREGRRRIRFTVDHCLSLRPAADYAAALAGAGFRVDEFLEGYPGSPPEVEHERRMIFVARRG